MQLDIPSDLAYGAGGRPPDIAANDPLTFVVQINEVSDTAPARLSRRAGRSPGGRAGPSVGLVQPWHHH